MSSNSRPNDASPSTYHPFDTLPTELIVQAFLNINRSQLVSFARVSSRWRDIATPLLYSAIKLDWKYRRAHLLIDELDRRPNLLPLITAFSVELVSDRELTSDVIDKCADDLEDRLADDWELSELYEPLWELKKAEMRSREEAVPTNEQVARRLPKHRWMRKDALRLCSLPAVNCRLRELLVSREKQKPEGAWLGGDGRVRSLEVLGRVIASMSGLTQLHLSGPGMRELVDFTPLGLEDSFVTLAASLKHAVLVNMDPTPLLPLVYNVQSLDLTLLPTFPEHLSFPNLTRLRFWSPSLPGPGFTYEPTTTLAVIRLLNAAPNVQVLETQPELFETALERPDFQYSPPSLRHFSFIQELLESYTPSDTFTTFLATLPNLKKVSFTLPWDLNCPALRLIPSLPPTLKTVNILIEAYLPSSTTLALSEALADYFATIPNGSPTPTVVIRYEPYHMYPDMDFFKEFVEECSFSSVKLVQRDCSSSGEGREDEPEDRWWETVSH